MFTQTPKSSILFVVALLVFFALASTACSFSGVRVSTHLPMIDITLTQEQFDHFSLKGGVDIGYPCDDLLDELSRVEMHDGFIRYWGTKVQPDGSKVYGSIDMSLGAENDMLKAKIVAVDIPGTELNDPLVDKVNQEMEDELAHSLTHSYGEVLFKEVVVKEGELRLRVQVNVDDFPVPSVRISID